MSNVTAKTSSNIFYKARCTASAHNERLSSREGAADIMSIDRGRLYRIESGITNPYPEEVHLMADLYNSPELRNFYCRNCCPLGEDVPEISTAEIDRIVIKALSSFRKLGETGEILLDITEDGIISDKEKPEMEKVLANLGELEKITQNLRAWIKKNLSNEVSK